MKQFKGSFRLAVEQIQVFATNTYFVREMKFLSQHFEQIASIISICTIDSNVINTFNYNQFW